MRTQTYTVRHVIDRIAFRHMLKSFQRNGELTFTEKGGLFASVFTVTAVPSVHANLRRLLRLPQRRPW